MRYHLFACPDYYPGGGLNDYIGSYDSLDEVKAEMNRTEPSYHYPAGIRTEYQRRVHEMCWFEVVIEKDGNLVQVDF